MRAEGDAQGQTRPSAWRTNPAGRRESPNAPVAKCRRLDTAGLAQRERREQREEELKGREECGTRNKEAAV